MVIQQITQPQSISSIKINFPDKILKFKQKYKNN